MISLLDLQVKSVREVYMMRAIFETKTIVDVLLCASQVTTKAEAGKSPLYKLLFTSTTAHLFDRSMAYMSVHLYLLLNQSALKLHNFKILRNTTNQEVQEAHGLRKFLKINLSGLELAQDDNGNKVKKD